MKKSLLFLLMAILLLPGAMKAQLPENQRIMGHFDTDAISTEGVRVSSPATGVITVGVILDTEEVEMFMGGKIVAFRVGLAEATTISRVFVIPINAAGGYGTVVPWTCNASSAGWNTIEIPTPYTIDIQEGEKLLIGFDYQQTEDNAPLSMVQEGTIYDTYQYKRVGRIPMWATAGLSSHGNLCLQCIVEHDNFPEILIRTSDLVSEKYINSGDDLPFSFVAKNKGPKVVEANTLTFDIKVDGETMLSITNPEPLTADPITMSGVVSTEGLASGEHTLSVEAVSLNGEPVDNVRPLTHKFTVHNGVFPRQKHMIEQFTSTYCTYCPLGNSMLSLVKAQRDDVIWVGVHGNLGSGVDPYTTQQGDSLMAYMGSNSYPSAAFDRAPGWENANVVNSIGYYEQYHQQIADELCGFFDALDETPNFISINIEPKVDLATREAVIKVSGEMSEDFDVLLGTDNKLSIYLTEDSLIAPQLNSGTWVSQYMHNGVFRWALGSVLGVNLNKVGNTTYEHEYSLTLPDHWKIENMNVVAFISRPLQNRVMSDLRILNAESVRLLGESGGVDELIGNQDIVPVEYYDIMGRQYDSLQQGINIVKMSDGTARKVLVK